MADAATIDASQTDENPSDASTGPSRDRDALIPQLARAVRQVEAGVKRGAASRSTRVKLQVVAQLAREERARVKSDAALTPAERTEDLKRLDGIAVILAKAASREPTLLPLLGEGAPVTDAVKERKREMLLAAGLEPEPEPEPVAEPESQEPQAPQVVPPSVHRVTLANPFLEPDLTHLRRRPERDRLAGFDLLSPLYLSFEVAADGKPACMPMPEPKQRVAPGGEELMHHQAQLVQAARDGHRSFLLADEPGLGKTAQALLAAQAADAFPLLVVAPSVVKINWARETERWVPGRRAAVVQGDGNELDAFADVVIVNYEVLDRHLGWLERFGFRGMVVDEAHFIKNTRSKRSRHVLQIAAAMRERVGNPLLMALTGTPLINDIEDFGAIWRFLGWIDHKEPNAELTDDLEEIGLTPMDRGFYPAARKAVIDMGIVRRRKIDVASDIPARRIADIPVELDESEVRSIRAAERELVDRMLRRYDAAMLQRSADEAEGVDDDLVHRIARGEVETQEGGTGENVFALARRIGRAKADLAADYAAQLAHSVGKVVFFAKHIDVLDTAEATLAKAGIKTVSIRGDQTPTQRQKAIDAFTNDASVQVIVCSLMAAGVGVNLQAAADMVLAELSWTDAEQTQAIDRIHRIGQQMPVTVWRILAAQTIDTRIAELLDTKAGLVGRAIDGAAGDEPTSGDLRLAAVEGMLRDAIVARAQS
ncbi:Helicase conserved C-terminal domain-containing protein [Agrococcus baldri]|uniref:Helicase conserved C-terminal domain-containing protein n=1 Tax=Agrococcus baldri TaxID=153730 RepID=A0AA94L090_9MICO|nr:DEAD/DEAH box helicase [Agrococcus baldri]SFS15183.1 Helicase conserved C-terminal domain-containing protein [Agrococcus baldri]